MNKDKIHITITGDVSDWNIPQFTLERIPLMFRRIIEASDLFVCNLEGPIKVADNYPGLELTEHRHLNKFFVTILKMIKKKQPIVYSSPSIVQLLSLCTESCAVLANNHIKDLGRQGVSDTIELLRAHRVSYLGAGENRRQANTHLRLRIKGKDIFILNYNYVGLRKYGLYANIYGATENGFGAAYLPPNAIRSSIKGMRAISPDAFVLLIIHAGRAMANRLEHTEINYSMFERLGAHCVVFHHSHKFFGSPTGKSFFLGDFVFLHHETLSESRPGGFVELAVDPSSNEFDHRSHVYEFDGGSPKVD